MARTEGSRNHDYEDKRQALLDAAARRLVQPDGARVSFRELASSAGVSVPTLKHYFGSRDNLVHQAIAQLGKMGATWNQRAAEVEQEDLASSIRWLMGQLHMGWQLGVGRLMTLGLEAGLGDDTLGPATVDHLLEPMLQATEARLDWHREQGHLDDCDLRHAALALISPLFLAMLHQGPLGGEGCRPLDTTAFVDDHVTRWLRAYGRDGA